MDIENQDRLTELDSSSTWERNEEAAYRPERFQNFVGQTKVKENLCLFIAAAKKRSESLDHCLLSGPPGLGKTTLANIVAKEMGADLYTISGPALDKKGDIASLLTNLKANDVLFIDEIHRLPMAVEEVLYSAMEDYKLDIILGQGPGARTVQLDLPPFTLVGATTRSGLLSSPLRDRFGIHLSLNFYKPHELSLIIESHLQQLGMQIEPEAATELAKRSRGTPRIALRLLRRVRDFAEVQGLQKVTSTIVATALERLGVDKLGLDAMDLKIITTIIDRFRGGPVGLDTIASCVGEESQTIEDVYEPFLLQQGFIQRTPRGRVAEQRAYQHLGRFEKKPLES